MLNVHPEVAEFVGLDSFKFTHWLILPETEKYYPFAKAVRLDANSDRQRIESKGIKVLPIGANPNLPTKPVYKN